MQNQNRAGSGKTIINPDIFSHSEPCRVCRAKVGKQGQRNSDEMMMVPCSCDIQNRGIHKECFQEWINSIWYKDHWQGEYPAATKKSRQYQPINKITHPLHSLTCLGCKHAISVQGTLKKKCRKGSQIEPINIFKLIGMLFLIALFTYFGVSQCRRVISNDEGLGVFLWILFGIGFVIFLVLLASTIIQAFWRNILEDIRLLTEGMEVSRTQIKKQRKNQNNFMDNYQSNHRSTDSGDYVQ